MEKKVKYEMEYLIRVSRQLLYQYISTPSGLSEWFADNVNSRGVLFTFKWDYESGEDKETAKLIRKKNDESVKFRWEEDQGEEYFFEMKIIEDDLTKDVSLLITDFAEKKDLITAKLMWDNQINNLKQVLGANV